MQLELRHLRSFLAVAEELSFTRAAKRLHVAQPALSAQIRQLESQVGCDLFVRATRKVELTSHGDRSGLFGLSLATGEGLELVWLPAVLLGASWPRDRRPSLRTCRHRLARRP
jgi:hypothetical protein